MRRAVSYREWNYTRSLMDPLVNNYVLNRCIHIQIYNPQKPLPPNKQQVKSEEQVISISNILNIEEESARIQNEQEVENMCIPDRLRYKMHKRRKYSRKVRRNKSQGKELSESKTKTVEETPHNNQNNNNITNHLLGITSKTEKILEEIIRMNINQSKLGSKMQSINKRLSIFEKGSKEHKGKEREVMEYLQREIEAVKGTTGGFMRDIAHYFNTGTGMGTGMGTGINGIHGIHGINTHTHHAQSMTGDLLIPSGRLFPPQGRYRGFNLRGEGVIREERDEYEYQGEGQGEGEGEGNEFPDNKYPGNEFPGIHYPGYPDPDPPLLSTPPGVHRGLQETPEHREIATKRTPNSSSRHKGTPLQISIPQDVEEDAGIGGMGGIGSRRTPPMSDQNAPRNIPPTQGGFLLHSPHRKGEGVEDAILMLLQEDDQVLAVNNTPPRPSTTRERTTPGSPAFHTPGVGVCPTSRGTRKNIPFNTLTNELDDLLIPKPKNFIFQCRNRGKTQLNIEDLLAGDLSNTPPRKEKTKTKTGNIIEILSTCVSTEAKDNPKEETKSVEVSEIDLYLMEDADETCINPFDKNALLSSISEQLDEDDKPQINNTHQMKTGSKYLKEREKENVEGISNIENIKNIETIENIQSIPIPEDGASKRKGSSASPPHLDSRNINIKGMVNNLKEVEKTKQNQFKRILKEKRKLMLERNYDRYKEDIATLRSQIKEIKPEINQNIEGWQPRLPTPIKEPS